MSRTKTESPSVEGLPAYLSVQEVAELFRVHPQSIRRAIHRGELPAVKIAGSIRISRSELEEHLRRREE